MVIDGVTRPRAEQKSKEDKIMINMQAIEAAKEKFGKLLEQQLQRVEEMKGQGDFIDYKARIKSSSECAEATE